jgi:hypothetical protein
VGNRKATICELHLLVPYTEYTYTFVDLVLHSPIRSIGIASFLPDKYAANSFSSSDIGVVLNAPYLATLVPVQNTNNRPGNAGFSPTV